MPTLLIALALAFVACGPSSPRVNALTQNKPPPGAIPPPDAPSDLANPDEDADGIPNANDACPTEPEDIEGFEDTDGCPDTDNDGDRIPDAADQCPSEPEVYNGTQDADGCPD